MITITNTTPITPPIQFGLDKLRAATKERSEFTLSLKQDDSLQREEYRRRTKQGEVVLQASGDAGFLYGILDLIPEVISQKGLGGHEGEVLITPYLTNRGIKFNIPLDARTPSYSDNSDSAAENIINMWDKSFWMDFLDQMAVNKFNLLTLWSLSPFPSLVKIPEFPEVALADVKRAMRPIKATTEGPGMYTPDMEESLVTIKKMTIEEKMAFWQWMMAYAKERCIRIMLYTWNLFVYGTEHNPYGITEKQDNPITKEYIYRGTKALLKTYPLLAGIGVTSGENMFRDETDIPFIRQTYGRAVEEMMLEEPNRQFHFIHRMQYTNQKRIVEQFQDFPRNFEIEFKYSQAHMYSNTKPVFINSFLAEKDPGIKIWVTARNDDFYMYRWGNPEFAREYLRQLPVDTMEGFLVGADGYTWGRDYISRDRSHPLVMDKMWYSFFIWGQLAYNIKLPRETFVNAIKQRLRPKQEQLLYETWQAVSDIIPAVNCTHWHDFDFQWYPEGCCMYDPDHDKLVFADINEFMSCSSVPGDEYESVAEYTKRLRNSGERLKLTAEESEETAEATEKETEETAEATEKETEETVEATAEGIAETNCLRGKITPLQQVAKIRQLVSQGLSGIAVLEQQENACFELVQTIEDIRALSYLGSYYADKIEAAVHLCYARMGMGNEYQEQAVRLLESAAAHWMLYAKQSKKLYLPQKLTRLGGNVVDVERFCSLVKLDILMAPKPDVARKRGMKK